MDNVTGWYDSTISADTFAEMVEKTQNLSMRDTVILTAAYIDIWLIELLHQRLIQESKKEQWYARPEYSYVNRVKLAYSVGLFNKNMESDLRYIGHLRNRFAHDPHVGCVEDVRAEATKILNNNQLVEDMIISVKKGIEHESGGLCKPEQVDEFFTKDNELRFLLCIMVGVVKSISNIQRISSD